MATITNSVLMQEIRDVGKIQGGINAIPNQLGNQVVPVIDVNPKHSRITNFIVQARRDATGGVTIATTDTIKDTYITTITYNMIKDATCDVALANDCGISVIVDGATKKISLSSFLTLTAQSSNVVLNLSNPIKVDKNTSILIISNTYTVGLMQRQATVMGYTIDNSNA